MNSEKSILSTVGFLARKYPQACSFSLGRPNPDVYALLDFDLYRNIYKKSLKVKFNNDVQQINEHLCTYGSSQGELMNIFLIGWLMMRISMSTKMIFLLPMDVRKPTILFCCMSCAMITIMP